MKSVESVQLPFLKDPAQVVTYPNGYQLVFVPKRGDVFNINTWVKTGSIHEATDINGVSHFLEHLMFKGTSRFKPGEFDKMMESNGGIINAATWKDFTFYYITGPKQGQFFETALDMHADMLLHSTLPDAEIGPQYDPNDPNYSGDKRERSVVIEEISMRNDQPWTKIFNAVNHMMYQDGHPYQWDVIGTKEIIGHIPREHIVDYYQRWYSPAALTTVVVGDFELDEVCTLVEKHFDFSHQPSTDGPALIEDLPLQPASKRFAELKGDYQTTFFIQGYHAPRPQHLAETIAMDIASYALGEGRSSRLTQALVEKPKRPVFNFVGCGQSTYKLGNVFYVQGNFQADDYQKPMAQVRAEIDKFLTTEPVTQDEMNRAIKKLKASFAETSETASGIAESIGESMTIAGNLSLYKDYLSVLETITLDQVRAVAQQYLNEDKAFTAVLLPN